MLAAAEHRVCISTTPYAHTHAHEAHSSVLHSTAAQHSSTHVNCNLLMTNHRNSPVTYYYNSILVHIYTCTYEKLQNRMKQNNNVLCSFLLLFCIRDVCMGVHAFMDKPRDAAAKVWSTHTHTHSHNHITHQRTVTVCTASEI